MLLRRNQCGVEKCKQQLTSQLIAAEAFCRQLLATRMHGTHLSQQLSNMWCCRHAELLDRSKDLCWISGKRQLGNLRESLIL